MGFLKWLFIAAAAYAGLIALIYVAQRSLLYFPERLRTSPAAAGLPEAHEISLATRDRETVIVWYVPPRGEKPVVLYFHGNGGALRYRVARFRAVIADGNGLIALSYRGFGGSTGARGVPRSRCGEYDCACPSASAYSVERVSVVVLVAHAGSRVPRVSS